MKPICIYHGNCADGFGAAWVFKRWADREHDFHAGVYQNPPPDVEGRDVYLVDFSYKRAVVEEICEKATRVVLIDHHKTAIEDLKPLIESRRIEALVNLEKSGATLAWEWFHGQERQRVPSQLRRRARFRGDVMSELTHPTTDLRLDPEFKAKWMVALRSGSYTQGKERLRDPDNNFCCLGVSCDLLDPNAWSEELNPNYNTPGCNWGRHQTGIVGQELDNALGVPRGTAKQLSLMNDLRGATFLDIAEWIEANL